MTALSVVELEPGCKSVGAVGIGGEGSVVGPFGLQGAVESLHLAVLPRAVRLDEFVPGTQVANGQCHVGRSAVAEMVVCDYPFDARNPLGRKVSG